jgi:hypothetical protein
MQPAQNLRDVIWRMITAAPGGHTLGSFRRICFIGTTDQQEWNLVQATKLITDRFGQPSAADQLNYSLSPVDIVFDTQNTELYVAGRDRMALGAAQTIQDATASEAVQNYV